MLDHVKTTGLKVAKTPFNAWCLGPMIDAAHVCNIISDHTKKQAELVQDFRKLIHPGRAIRLKDACSLGTAYDRACGSREGRRGPGSIPKAPIRSLS